MCDVVMRWRWGWEQAEEQSVLTMNWKLFISALLWGVDVLPRWEGWESFTLLLIARQIYHVLNLSEIVHSQTRGTL